MSITNSLKAESKQPGFILFIITMLAIIVAVPKMVLSDTNKVSVTTPHANQSALPAVAEILSPSPSGKASKTAIVQSANTVKGASIPTATTLTPSTTLVAPTVRSTNSLPVVSVLSNTTQTTQDYSSYKLPLQNTLSSLQSRVDNIRSQADQVPQQVNDAIAQNTSTTNSINNNRQADINRQTIATNQAMATRGISGGTYYDQELANALAPINQFYDNQIAQLPTSDQIRANGIAKVQLYAAQDQDLSNKIGVVQSLLNKLSNGTFGSSDVSLTLQAINY